jgi:hypothetical protein
MRVDDDNLPLLKWDLLSSRHARRLEADRLADRRGEHLDRRQEPPYSHLWHKDTERTSQGGLATNKKNQWSKRDVGSLEEHLPQRLRPVTMSVAGVI